MIASILVTDVGDKFGMTPTSGVGDISVYCCHRNSLSFNVSVGHQKYPQIYHQDRKFVANIKKLLSSLSPQHQDVTNISDLGYSDCLRIQSGNIDVRW